MVVGGAGMACSGLRIGGGEGGEDTESRLLSVKGLTDDVIFV